MHPRAPVAASLFVLASLASSAARADAPAAAADARGDEELPALPSPAPRVDARFAAIRAAIVEGRLQAARVELDVLATDESTDTRAAAAELRAVVEAWIVAAGERGSFAIVAPGRKPSPWQDAFSAARLALVSGEHARAAHRFSVLEKTAPDEASAASARELGALAVALDDEVERPVAKRAQPASAPTPSAHGAAPPVRERWYGWQTLIADGASILTSPIGVGVGGYFLAAPIIHAAHGQWGKAGLDAGLRLGLPVGGCFAGAATADSDGYDGLGRCAVGALVGVIGAITVDAAVLAREDVTAKQEAPTVAWQPTLAPRKEGGMTVGVGGTF